MTNIEELKAKQEKEMREAVLSNEIAGMLPVEPKMIVIQRDHASVKYGLDYPARHSIREAINIMRKFDKIVESQAWRDSCLSIGPAAINDYSKKPGAKLDFVSYALIVLNAGEGYSSHELRFWSMAGEHLIEVSVEINPPHKMMPQAGWTSRDLDTRQWRVVPVCVGEDNMVKWWSPEGSYSIVYSWADVHNFNAWASNE